MGELHTAYVVPNVANRILDFLNHAKTAVEIAGKEPVRGPVLDDLAKGARPGIRGYDIGLTVAKRILIKRNSLAGKVFTDLSQLNGISYFGQDKFDDLAHTFSRYWERFLAVNRLEQETNFYCGSASAQMILDFLHGWGGAPVIDQDDIWDTIQGHVQEDDDWATDPPGLAGVLNDESPDENVWLVYTTGEFLPDPATKKAAVTMNTYDAPPAALINDGDHWVVISGVTATEAPSMESAAFIIYTIRIHDPGIGSNVREIAYHTWCENVLTPNTWGTTYKDKHVCVVDPKVPKAKNVRPAMPNRKTKGNKLITLADAKRYALEALDDYHLSDREDYKKALVRTTPGKPILVKNLKKRRKRFYYLVPFVKDRTRVVLMIDGYYGNYLGSSIVDKPKGYIDISSSKARNIAHKHLEKFKRGNLAKVRKPWLVWKPCRETRDPFSPMWKTEVEGRRRYVNQQGEVSSRINREKKGGM